MRNGCVHGELVWRDRVAIAVDLIKATVPLSGILYEQGQSQQDQDLQCGATVKGTSELVAHRLTNLQALKNQLAQQVSRNPFLNIYINVEYNSASSTLSHLSCGGACVESQTQFFYADSLVVYIVIRIGSANPC